MMATLTILQQNRVVEVGKFGGSVNSGEQRTWTRKSISQSRRSRFRKRPPRQTSRNRNKCMVYGHGHGFLRLQWKRSLGLKGSELSPSLFTLPLTRNWANSNYSHSWDSGGTLHQKKKLKCGFFCFAIDVNDLRAVRVVLASVLAI